MDAFYAFNDLFFALFVHNFSSVDMAHPYQCIQVCKPDPKNQEKWMILGACGPNIASYVSTGTTAIWSMQEKSEVSSEGVF